MRPRELRVVAKDVVAVIAAAELVLAHAANDGVVAVVTADVIPVALCDIRAHVAQQEAALAARQVGVVAEEHVRACVSLHRIDACASEDKIITLVAED